MRTVLHIALLVLMLAVLSCAQANAFDTYDVWGWGNDPCSNWTKARAEEETVGRLTGHYLAWIQGFLTGYNDFAPGGGHITKGMELPGDVLSWTDNYCKDHPDDPVVRAAVALIQDRVNP
jgi:hypothetical protein